VDLVKASRSTEVGDRQSMTTRAHEFADESSVTRRVVGVRHHPRSPGRVRSETAPRRARPSPRTGPDRQSRTGADTARGRSLRARAGWRSPGRPRSGRFRSGWRSGVWPLHSDGVRALLQAPGLIDHQDPVLGAEMIYDEAAPLGGDRVGVLHRPPEQCCIPHGRSSPACRPASNSSGDPPAPAVPAASTPKLSGPDSCSEGLERVEPVESEGSR
jgi:hypothetical protein